MKPKSLVPKDARCHRIFSLRLRSRCCRCQCQAARTRVAEDIERQIRSGRLKSGYKLLAERDLAEHYGVSYMTIRHATAILRERRLIRTIRGRGNYVA